MAKVKEVNARRPPRADVQTYVNTITGTQERHSLFVCFITDLCTEKGFFFFFSINIQQLPYLLKNYRA